MGLLDMTTEEYLKWKQHEDRGGSLTGGIRAAMRQYERELRRNQGGDGPPPQPTERRNLGERINDGMSLLSTETPNQGNQVGSGSDRQVSSERRIHGTNNGNTGQSNARPRGNNFQVQQPEGRPIQRRSLLSDDSEGTIEGTQLTLQEAQEHFGVTDTSSQNLIRQTVQQLRESTPEYQNMNDSEMLSRFAQENGLDRSRYTNDSEYLRTLRNKAAERYSNFHNRRQNEPLRDQNGMEVTRSLLD